MRLSHIAISCALLHSAVAPYAVAESASHASAPQNQNGPAIDNTGSIGIAGSTFVPLDSWVYPALRRLAALGFIPDQNSGLAPWTRTECAHQVTQAHSLVQAAGNTPEAEEALRLLGDLDIEFLADSDGEHALTFESAYTRFTGIGGTPLRDSYHFGQTIVNDFGRRYDNGVSNVTGFSGYANYGHFFAYLRGEYQYAPGRDTGYDLTTRQFIARSDQNPLQPATGISSTNRFDMLEGYVGAQFGFENISVGKESLWWGPGEASAFSFSNNAEPVYMVNFTQNRPIVLPSVLRYLGKIRTQFIFGELQGHHWPPRPLVNAQKVSFDITDNLEVGFTRSAFWGGVGHPFTIGSTWNSFVSTSSTGATFRYGDRTDPGDRHSGFDLRYRLPGLRRYVTIYTDSYSDDDPNPIDNPRRAAWAPGIYISHLPRLTRLDLRLETYSTLTYSDDRGGNFIYWNNQYHDAYTNVGNLLGSWVGRDGRAYVAEAGYWFDARTRIQAQYRHIEQGANYLPGGGTQTDGSLFVQWGITPEILATGWLQLEHYDIPIFPPSHHSAVAMLGITYTPHNASLQ